MKIQLVAFIAFCFFSVFFCRSANDSLVLCKRKNPAVEYKIPFGQYEVKIKIKGQKKITALITGAADSSLTVIASQGGA